MRLVWTILWAIVGGIVGYVVSVAGFGLLVYITLSARGVTDFGKPPAADILVLGPLLGLLGLGLGIWLALWVVRRARSKR
jgi:hypothetical protein